MSYSSTLEACTERAVLDAIKEARKHPIRVSSQLKQRTYHAFRFDSGSFFAVWRGRYLAWREEGIAGADLPMHPREWALTRTLDQAAREENKVIRQLRWEQGRPAASAKGVASRRAKAEQLERDIIAAAGP